MKTENIYKTGVAEAVLLKSLFPFAVAMTLLIWAAKYSGLYLGQHEEFNRPMEQIVNTLCFASIGLMLLYGIGFISKTLGAPKLKLNFKWAFAQIAMAVMVLVVCISMSIIVL